VILSGGSINVVYASSTIKYEHGHANTIQNIKDKDRVAKADLLSYSTRHILPNDSIQTLLRSNNM